MTETARAALDNFDEAFESALADLFSEENDVTEGDLKEYIGGGYLLAYLLERYRDMAVDRLEYEDGEERDRRNGSQF